MGDVIPFKKPDRNAKTSKVQAPLNVREKVTHGGPQKVITDEEATYIDVMKETASHRIALHEAGFSLMHQDHPQDPKTLRTITQAIYDGVMAVTREYDARKLRKIFNGVAVYMSAPKLEWRVDEQRNNQLHLPNSTSASQIETIIKLRLAR